MPHRAKGAPAVCADCGAQLETESRKLYCAACSRKRQKLASVNFYRKHRTKDENSPVVCDGCIYYRILTSGMYACHYCIDTGKLRRIPPKMCYRHRGTPYQRKGRKK